jgi:hypothetical protein
MTKKAIETIMRAIAMTKTAIVMKVRPPQQLLDERGRLRET